MAGGGAECGLYEKLNQQARGRTAETRLGLYLSHSVGTRSTPLVDDARSRLRPLVEENLADPTATFCNTRNRVVDAGIVKLTSSDELGGELLAACGRRFMTDGDWGIAREILAELQVKAPRSQVARATRKDLSKVPEKAAAQTEYRYALGTCGFSARTTSLPTRSTAAP